MHIPTGRNRSFSTGDFEPEDRALVERMLAGDEDAFDAFYDDTFPGLYRFAMARLKDPDLTREIVQSAICKAIANLRSWRGEAALAAWVVTICRHEIHHHYRKLQRTPPQVELTEEAPGVRAVLDTLAAGQDGPEETLRRKELARQVHVVLDRLPARYGRALEWKYLDGASVKEIAERLEVGPKAAESLLTRARNAFRDGLAAFDASLESGKTAASSLAALLLILPAVLSPALACRSASSNFPILSGGDR